MNDILGDALQQELITVADDRLFTAPFVRGLCDEEKVFVMREYIWIITGDMLKDLRDIETNASKTKYSDIMLFSRSHSGNMVLRIELKRVNDEEDVTAVCIFIDQTLFPLDIRYSAGCDEAEGVIDAFELTGRDTGDHDFGNMAFLLAAPSMRRIC